MERNEHIHLQQSLLFLRLKTDPYNPKILSQIVFKYFVVSYAQGYCKIYEDYIISYVMLYYQ